MLAVLVGDHCRADTSRTLHRRIKEGVHSAKLRSGQALLAEVDGQVLGETCGLLLAHPHVFRRLVRSQANSVLDGGVVVRQPTEQRGAFLAEREQRLALGYAGQFLHQRIASRFAGLEHVAVAGLPAFVGEFLKLKRPLRGWRASCTVIPKV